MKFMDKLRDMFTEEIDDVEPEIKSEVIQVEIPAPKKEEVKTLEKEEKVVEKQQPIFFDDNDFASLEKPKVQKQEKVSKVFEKPKRQVEVKKEEKKIFKPTPIISPVYGVLDKNYHKEDIKQKNNSYDMLYHNNRDVNIDDIRKKAFGTLEDDLEVTLFGDSKNLDSVTEEIDMFDELLDEKVEEKDESDLFNLIDSMYEKEGDDSGRSK